MFSNNRKTTKKTSFESAFDSNLDYDDRRLSQGKNLVYSSQVSMATTVRKRCHVCEGIIVNSASSTSVGKKVCHRECAYCAECGIEFSDISCEFKEHNGKLYCIADYRKLFNDCCVACGEKISGKFMEQGTSKYHLDCFSCSRCYNKIEGPFSIKNGNLVCKNCLIGRSSLKMEPSVSVTKEEKKERRNTTKPNKERISKTCHNNKDEEKSKNRHRRKKHHRKKNIKQNKSKEDGGSRQKHHK